MSIKNVIENGFCVGCGACRSVLKDKVKITMHQDGFYKARIVDNVHETELSRASTVCPFSPESINEDELGKILFKGKKHDKRIGFYNEVYTGYIQNISDRENSSSGGLTTWFAEKLLLNKEIDSVIHVGQADSMFEYRVSKSVSELKNISNKKSRYYPVTFEKLIHEVLNTNGRILFIGVPCFVKSIRLLQKELGLNNIKYVISLLCGHMKSADFGNCLAWQVGVKPGDLESIDFRVKKSGYEAGDYFIEVNSKSKNKVIHRNSNLMGTNWGHGFFKHKSCDFCDDIGGELADVTFGDAWLPRYTNDYLGTNIVISRNDIFDKYLMDYQTELYTEKVSIDDFYQTQAGNYRHRRDGLKVRIENEKGWLPKKRLYLSSVLSTIKRDKLYLHRRHMSDKSISNFIISKKYNSILLFQLLMLPLIIKYDYLNRGIGGAIKVNLRRILPEFIKEIIRK